MCVSSLKLPKCMSNLKLSLKLGFKVKYWKVKFSEYLEVDWIIKIWEFNKSQIYPHSKQIIIHIF